MAATIKDIAERAGCGLATVSSYLNGGNVRPANRKRIETAIRELNYVVNETARQLKTNRTRMIGAIIPELNSTFCASVLSEIEDILRQHGYAMLVCDCRSDSVREKEAVEFMLNRRVDGLFVIPVEPTGSNLQEFVESGKPLITIDRLIEGLECDSIAVDNREAIRSAVELLVKKGHRKIGMIVGPTEVNAARQRLKGYEMGCAENGIELPESYVFHSDGSIADGTRGVETLRALHPDMTAVIVSSFNLTMGVMIGIGDHGIEIPRELSVVGFDNPQFAKAVHPRLTIVNQPVQKIGEEAAELMLKRLQEHTAVENGGVDHEAAGSDAGKAETAPIVGSTKGGQAETDETIKHHIWLRAEILEGKSVAEVS